MVITAVMLVAAPAVMVVMVVTKLKMTMMPVTHDNKDAVKKRKEHTQVHRQRQRKTSRQIDI